MAQINVQIREDGNYRQSKSFVDDLTLRSHTSKLMMINSDSSVSSGGNVFVIRDPSQSNVAFITQLGDATFHHLVITGDTTFQGDLEVGGDTLLHGTLDVEGKEIGSVRTL